MLEEKNQILAGLNEEQRQAVTHKNGPLMIIAGAGTGKTTVITRRIAWLITKKLAKPGEILALTFTDKAANEMEGRVDQLVPYGYIDVAISTFHAFGDRLLRDHALSLGLSPDYRVISLPEQIIFFREHLFEFPLKHYRSLGDPTKHVEALLGVISRAKDEDVSPAEYLRWAIKQSKKRTKNDNRDEIEKQLEVAKVYEQYQTLKTKHGLIDFGDQVNLTLRLLRRHPAILKKIKNQFKYILVDEFQDTNYAQFQLLRLLAGPTANLAVVGDDDQSIYRFRGAAISNILSFGSIYKKCRKIVLIKNYRSTQNILDASRRLIKHNNPDRLEVKAKIDKRLIAVTGETGSKVEQRQFDTVNSEADWVAETIRTQFDANTRQLKDFAILVRSNKEAEAFCRSLNMAGLPYQFAGGGGLYYSPEVKLVTSFLRVVGDLADSLSLYDLSLSPIYQINPLDLQKINTFANRRNYTLHYVFAHLAEALDQQSEFSVLADLKESTHEVVKTIMNDLNYYLDYAKSKTTGEVLYTFLKRTGYLAKLAEKDSVDNENSLKNLAQYFNKVREFKEVARIDRVSEFVKYLNVLKESGDDPESGQPDIDADAVNILTIHKAKGLEFPVVFMVALVGEKFPARGRKQPIELPMSLLQESLPQGDYHLQEERRLFYVGMTRACQKLYLTSAVDYGGKRERKISQFVLEALDLPKVDLPITKRSLLAQIELFAPHDNLQPPTKKILSDEIVPLSFYQINDYLACPLKYKYVHLLKIPLLPNHQIIYGSALHQAVQAYYLAKKNRQRFGFRELERIFKYNWSAEGFISQQHEAARYKTGQLALKRFYQTAQKQKELPRYVEEPFTIVRDKIQIKGRWDLVVERAGRPVIIDFKSSDVRQQKEADRRVKESLQLSIYALAWQSMHGELPTGLELNFLETGLIGSGRRSDADLIKAWGEIANVAMGLRQAEFRPTANQYVCNNCPYNEICPSSAV